MIKGQQFNELPTIEELESEIESLGLMYEKLNIKNEELEHENAELKRIIAESRDQNKVLPTGKTYGIDGLRVFHSMHDVLFASPVIQEGITSEMVLAGCAELPKYQNTIGAAILVEAIFKAMLNASKPVNIDPLSKEEGENE